MISDICSDAFDSIEECAKSHPTTYAPFAAEIKDALVALAVLRKALVDGGSPFDAADQGPNLSTYDAMRRATR